MHGSGASARWFVMAMIAHVGHVLVVHPAVPARNVKELIAHDAG